MRNQKEQNGFVSSNARSKFDHLTLFVGLMKQDLNCCRGGGFSTSKIEKQLTVLDALLDSFLYMAELYFDKMQELIEVSKLDRKRQAYEYEICLRRLSSHALLLLDLVRFQTEFTQVRGSLTSHRAVIERLIPVITRRAIIAARSEPTPTPPLLMAAQGYQLIHFKYDSRAAVIGIPLHTLMSSSPLALGVLWHELGGLMIAQARHAFPGLHNNRRAGDGQLTLLQTWVQELDDLDKQVWKRLAPLYRASLLNNARVAIVEKQPEDYILSPFDVSGWLEIVQTLKDSLDIANQTPESLAWRSDWLGEFFEDLFGVQALGSVMVEALADALVSNYVRFDIGDATHPPPRLRLQVALAYIDLIKDQADEEGRKQWYDADKARTRIDQKYPGLLAAGPDPTMAGCDMAIAKIIATFYQKKVASEDFSRPNNKIDDDERQLASAIVQMHQLHNQASSGARKVADFKLKLQEEDAGSGVIEHLVITNSAQKIAQVRLGTGAQDDRYSLHEIENRCNRYHEEFSYAIQSCQSIEALKQIEFAVVDFDGEPQLPPPRKKKIQKTEDTPLLLVGG